MEETEQLTEEYEYVERTGFGRRFGAFTIDLLIAGIIAIIIGIGFSKNNVPDSTITNLLRGNTTHTKSVVTTYSGKETSTETQYRTNTNYDGSASMFVVILGLFELFTGASLGKKALGIKVKTAHGAKASFGQYLLRWCLKYSYFILSILAAVSGFFLLPVFKFIAGFFLFFSGLFVLADDRRSFHDLLSKTAVFSV